MLPGLMNLTRMSASGGMEIGDGAGGSWSGGWRRDPSERRGDAAHQVLLSELSGLSDQSRGLRPPLLVISDGAAGLINACPARYGSVA
jgi:hypothetical protein